MFYWPAKMFYWPAKKWPDDVDVLSMTFSTATSTAHRMLATSPRTPGSAYKMAANSCGWGSSSFFFDMTSVGWTEVTGKNWKIHKSIIWSRIQIWFLKTKRHPKKMETCKSDVLLKHHTLFGEKNKRKSIVQKVPSMCHSTQVHLFAKWTSLWQMKSLFSMRVWVDSYWYLQPSLWGTFVAKKTLFWLKLHWWYKQW